MGVNLSGKLSEYFVPKVMLKLLTFLHLRETQILLVLLKPGLQVGRAGECSLTQKKSTRITNIFGLPSELFLPTPFLSCLEIFVLGGKILMALVTSLIKRVYVTGVETRCGTVL